MRLYRLFIMPHFLASNFPPIAIVYLYSCMMFMATVFIDVLMFPCLVQHSSTANNAAANGTGASELADDDLPSVMTCANYLKLPPYSTKVFSFGILVKQ